MPMMLSHKLYLTHFRLMAIKQPKSKMLWIATFSALNHQVLYHQAQYRAFLVLCLLNKLQFHNNNKVLSRCQTSKTRKSWPMKSTKGQNNLRRMPSRRKIQSSLKKTTLRLKIMLRKLIRTYSKWLTKYSSQFSQH